MKEAGRAEHRPARDVTGLLVAWGEGEKSALDRLLPLVYAELRRIARNRLRHERAEHTLQPTALVNEVYLRLVGVKGVAWQNRAQFFAICARLMRQVLVDAARAHRGAKRGGGAIRVMLDDAHVRIDGPPAEVIALDDALHALARIDERKSRVVELRFFAGLDGEETAAVLGVSTDTVARDWKFAKTWLYRELRDGRRPTA
jgi:RNA polymerase sigma factor (TIGR02999 family)